MADERQLLEDFQHAAYTRTEVAVGARAIPLEWDYGAILDECEVWFDEDAKVLIGVLILRIMPDRLFLESIATAPQAGGSGRGRLLLEATFERARELGLNRVGLITNSLNPALAWYKRVGFTIDHEEQKAGRVVVHMSARVPETGHDPERED
ncbi:MAG: GNAT family N-acetyltransferase [Hoeflea sp.]|uniref:GNAT family N-acetyltransferase n=1 Tax=Hoeflea sp. TaxID=1940281 RepID=UPI001D241DFD|nr:GNAT family N-acetyltransferase [Hoeflea sp.]MBU4528173.1 GNAT family N-acetyltransferase [Alphaproteobacteria bacterium]MBU4543769.1 GNAT family N-acetyltransferase [Alphaproteobacteria bacterium]MBU4548636.1 GNAT family N-acetyltransferase [Alphaproteobacteria bacterium]MBV1725802.1 GNAT family N-acetyltransferase [Hoeflea sp.]MBV1762158.1 GNAT family N-acetyltransferase [Hoeflea sp.]